MLLTINSLLQLETRRLLVSESKVTVVMKTNHNK